MSHWLKLSRALDHVDALDRAIKGWLAGDSYRFVKEYDTETRRVAIVARISEPIPPAWGPMIGDVVHNLRSALDHLAFALNAKGYADANNGATLPEDGTEARYQPVVPTLRGLRDYIRFKVAFPLDKWL
jgi:hypothetical protein